MMRKNLLSKHDAKQVSTDDDFWYSKDVDLIAPRINGRAGNKGYWSYRNGISNHPYDGINTKFGVLCEIRIKK